MTRSSDRFPECHGCCEPFSCGTDPTFGGFDRSGLRGLGDPPPRTKIISGDNNGIGRHCPRCGRQFLLGTIYEQQPEQGLVARLHATGFSSGRTYLLRCSLGLVDLCAAASHAGPEIKIGIPAHWRARGQTSAARSHEHLAHRSGSRGIGSPVLASTTVVFASTTVFAAAGAHAAGALSSGTSRATRSTGAGLGVDVGDAG